MEKLDNQAIKERLIRLLMEYTQFCETYSLKYSLAGGTLLGAIRHKGFIPWDDDIDVCMPRDEYEKFIRLAPKYLMKKHFVLQAGGVNGFFDYPFAKILDLETEVKTKYNKNDSNLWIDVFPVDGLPSDLNEVKKVYENVEILRKLLLLTKARLCEGKGIFKKTFKFIPKIFATLYGAQRASEGIEKIRKRYPYESCKYVGIVTWGLYGVGERMLKSEFEKSVEVEFEEHKFKAFSCWDSYLKGLYGDYMQLPPIEKRKTHDMEAYYIEK